MIFADVNTLKRSTISGPVTSRMLASAVSGTSSPDFARTYTLRMSSGYARKRGSDCSCTWYTRPERLKSFTYSAPNVLCRVSNTSVDRHAERHRLLAIEIDAHLRHAGAEGRLDLAC